MSNAICQPRFSIDLGVRTAHDPPVEITGRNPDNRHHPLRLQHSPSLPNIWFPPHSGPIPPEITDNIPKRPQRPSTPPSLMADASSLPAKDSALEPDDRRTQVPEAKAQVSSKFQRRSLVNVTFHPTAIAHSQSSQNRHRKEREHSYSLLTPPLTPSSSIRTTASVESDTAQKSGEGSDSFDRAGEIEDGDPSCTRFLILHNVSRQINAEFLRSAVVGTLLSNSPQKFSEVEGVSSKFKGPRMDREILKGVFIRCQISHGIILLAFYDARWAKISMEVLPIRTQSDLSRCVGDELATDGTQAWLSCNFLTMEELIQTIGNSAFAAAVDGGFNLRAQKDGRGPSSPTEEASVGNAISEGAAGHVAEFTDVDVDALKDILGSYGDVRSLCCTEKKTEGNETYAKDFYVEYFDIRDADAAYVALENTTISGIMFHVSGREMSTQSTHSAHNSSDNFTHTMTDPHPSIAVTGSEDLTGCFGRPGLRSHIRERFAPVDDPVAAGLKNLNAGDDASSPQELQSSRISPSHEGAQSPTYFYSSSMSSLVAASQPHPGLSGHGSENLERRAPQRFEGETFVRQDIAPQCYTPLQDCRYCPSRGPSSNAPYSPYYGAHVQPAPPLPSVYFPPHTSSCSSDMAPSTTSSASTYSYDGQQLQSGINMPVPNWMYDHGVIAVPGNRPVVPNAALPTPHPGPYWYADGHGGLMLGGTCYTSQMPPPDSTHIPYYPSTSGPSTQGDHCAQPHMYMTGPGSLPPSMALVSPLSAQSSPTATASPGSGNPQERNQLNLARIEEGLDTRTTVMIKNIPNKMTDKDLIAYIGKVCPRRIDFLYLRMDFTNGCNVGYAFVNFIHVQDLLLFAKKRLGEKWNMFSSEKVLQMSYANYQGKEALVEKFKNSCIMDEREEWRPKIFYSTEPNQGLSEPFPAPTHLRRKERSSYNRGALFVPGVTGGTQGPRTHLHNSSRRQNHPHEEQRTYPIRYLERQPHRTRNVDEQEDSRNRQDDMRN